MQHQTQDKHILISCGPSFLEAVNDLIAYWLFDCHGTVRLKQIAKGEQDMVQARVVCLRNIVCNGKRLENELQATTRSSQSFYSLSDQIRCSLMKFVPKTVVPYRLEHLTCIRLLLGISSLTNNLFRSTKPKTADGTFNG
jgi:hypothetical protein